MALCDRCGQDIAEECQCRDSLEQCTLVVEFDGHIDDLREMLYRSMPTWMVLVEYSTSSELKKLRCDSSDLESVMETLRYHKIPVS